jgi:hypothetical protein
VRQHWYLLTLADGAVGADVFVAVAVVRPAVRWAEVPAALAADASPAAASAWSTLAGPPPRGAAALAQGLRRMLGNGAVVRVRGNDEDAWGALRACAPWLARIDLLDRDLHLMGQIRDGARSAVLRLTDVEHGEVSARVGAAVTAEQLEDNSPWIRLRSPSGP